MGVVVGPSSPEFCVVSLFVILLEKGFVHLLVFLLQNNALCVWWPKTEQSCLLHNLATAISGPGQGMIWIQESWCCHTNLNIFFLPIISFYFPFHFSFLSSAFLCYIPLYHLLLFSPTFLPTSPSSHLFIVTTVGGPELGSSLILFRPNSPVTESCGPLPSPS